MAAVVGEIAAPHHRFDDEGRLDDEGAELPVAISTCRNIRRDGGSPSGGRTADCKPIDRKIGLDPICGTTGTPMQLKRLGLAGVPTIVGTARKGFSAGVAGEEQVLEFIGSTFRSVWAIEVLRFVVANAEFPHSADQLIERLRASRSVVDQSIDQLLAVALVVIDDDGEIRFRPASAELASLVDEALSLYERRPNQVRRKIVSHTSPGIAAFSEAFRLRKD
ncbi:hypothetical protein KRR38_27795 [Novosphingobium sp. G106]|uniref:hypothetical protein n=1 Tax=Novosphingobium sp. G106 TaxID=2849500 RepID=UPI001C2D491A|nr:hypothetical protein [Novosphingobium sp. G106]MBV1691384.1 hypothetical protein [Novosphingobium sp. G106]